MAVVIAGVRCLGSDVRRNCLRSRLSATSDVPMLMSMAILSDSDAIEFSYRLKELSMLSKKKTKKGADKLPF